LVQIEIDPAALAANVIDAVVSAIETLGFQARTGVTQAEATRTAAQLDAEFDRSWRASVETRRAAGPRKIEVEILALRSPGEARPSPGV
jgi:hypothetical protein